MNQIYREQVHHFFSRRKQKKNDLAFVVSMNKYISGNVSSDLFFDV